MRSPQRLSDHELREVRCKECHTPLELEIKIRRVGYRNPTLKGKLEWLPLPAFLKVRLFHMGLALHPGIKNSLE
jgi:hypothetical protein